MSESLKRLFQPPLEQKAPGRNRLMGREPLLDSRETAVLAPVAAAPKMEAKTVARTDSGKQKSKTLTAREYATILSAILLFTSLLSQGAAIIGCAKTVIDSQKPVVTLDSGQTVKSSQTAAPVVAPQKTVADDRMSNVSIAPAPLNPDPSSNLSIIAPNYYSNVTAP